MGDGRDSYDDRPMLVSDGAGNVIGRVGGMVTSGEVYDADYFLRGKQTGRSLYENYRWLPDLTIPMVAAMIRHLGIKPDDKILDFGCARGYVVKAFREMGYRATNQLPGDEHQLAAAAGLGTLDAEGRLVTPRRSPRVHVADEVIYTDLPLAPDGEA